MAIQVNFSEVDIKEFEPMPAGSYLVNLVEVEQVTAQTEKATQYMKCKYQVMDPEEYTDRFLWDNLMLEGKGMFRLKQALLAAGFSNDELEAGIDFEPQDLIGTEFMVSISIKRSEEDGDQNVIRRYNPA